MKSRVGSVTAKGSAVLLSAALAYAQVDTGCVSGTVRDNTGGVLTGTESTLFNEGTGFTQKTQTGEGGQYAFSQVKVGSYTATADANRFEKSTRAHITVNVEQHATADLVLNPLHITETAVVTRDAPLIQAADPSVDR